MTSVVIQGALAAGRGFPLWNAQRHAHREQLLSHVVVDGACWLWAGPKNRKGYGTVVRGAGSKLLGSALDNVRDMLERQRGGWLLRYGEQHGQCRLSDVQVAEIRATPHRRGAYADLARKFGVNRTTVQRIATGRARVHGSKVEHHAQGEAV